MKQWKILCQNDKVVAKLCGALGCTHFFARTLINRGIKTVEEARSFLDMNADVLHDPFLFRDMEAVVERIGLAIRKGEKITVYGDYDVDGITATGLLLKVLEELGSQVDYFIPSRFTEGYGVNSAALQRIAESGTRLLITVDTGITAVKETEEAKALGMDVIITDHHECQSLLPNTLILNPKQEGCGYPFKELAGVGVVYKLVCALDQRFGNGDGWLRYTPFAAIGTVADIMLMRGENRFIVRKGLEKLKETESIGLHSLLDQCVGDRPLDTSTVGFILAPRLNAAGRMGEASLSVELLTTNLKSRADALVEELCKENNLRQATENKILEEAIEMIEGDPENAKRQAIVLWDANWHNGVIGIVASRLKERYGKPCILFTVNGDLAKGSGRSVRPFNLFETLEHLSHHLERYGGHAFAAGVLAKTECLEVFRNELCSEVEAFLQTNAFDESIEVECVLKGADLTVANISALEALAPFGRGNETPLYCAKNITVVEAVPTANGNHMRLVFDVDGRRLSAFYFHVSPDRFCYQAGDLVDIVFEADINTYNSHKSVRLLVKDIRFSADFEEDMKRLKSHEICSSDIPSREDTAALFRFLKKQIDIGARQLDFYTFPKRIEAEGFRKLSLGAIYFSMRILKELGVLEYQHDGSVVSNLKIHCEKKVSLEDSSIRTEIMRKAGEMG